MTCRSEEDLEDTNRSKRNKCAHNPNIPLVPIDLTASGDKDEDDGSGEDELNELIDFFSPSDTDEDELNELIDFFSPSDTASEVIEIHD